MITKSEQMIPFFEFLDQIYRIICEAIHLSKGFDFMSFQQLKKKYLESNRKPGAFDLSVIHFQTHLLKE